MALPEPLAKSTKNREACDPDEDSPEPLIKRTRKSEDLDSETPSYKKAELQAREKEPSSPYSDYTTGDEDEGETDSSCWSEHKENDSARHWTYKDLMNLNISYEKTPLENFIKEVKDAFMNAKGFCPDSSRMNSVLKRHLENLAFSYDTTDLRDDRVYSNPYFEVRMILKEMKKYLQQWNKNSEKLLNENQFYEALDPSTKKSAQKLIDVLDFAVQTFAGETIQLVRKILLEKESDEGRGGRARGQGSKGHHGGKAREQSRGGQGGLHGCQDTEFVQISGNFLKNYFDIFGRMFFLVSGEVHAGCFTFENRTVWTTPDRVYNYLADSGYPPDELFFIVEV
ncbi:uncharacterized protein LOC133179731 [Saccostrea echinata]|uniref:uncharacterized protein LOC133179731 n=1 Tax=Saccostrea echinata TaxID=191078 RepID=UPI002A823500|nr:uncharacterized protein LOC133179731 [Saccostrea echinata]